ncbi:hypothetical protein MN116_008632 [Schistosoma mekongi]|uniref:Uncharacterized protein n=1 Tax=Schistosoma mekongi TaxID=38744 RepID=A0AAE2D1J0_SCHME|nr:hypothetical protein MN116_008632 [Schistosoma mekongi]
MSSESCHKYSTVSIQVSDRPIDLLYHDAYSDDNDGYITSTINNNKLSCDKVTLAGIARRGAMVDVGAIMVKRTRKNVNHEKSLREQNVYFNYLKPKCVIKDKLYETNQL